MKFTLRKTNDYAICSLTEGSTEIDFGMLTNADAKALLEEMKSAVEDLEWFIHTTED